MSQAKVAPDKIDFRASLELHFLKGFLFSQEKLVYFFLNK
jgi:hypothetical protein